jgi:antitoxin component of RelBE/YafQ-DinJ toxin-antitoxin module
MPETTPRAIRIPDDLWENAKAATEANGDTVSDVVRRALERYVRAHPPE